jgi:hypothetical protein
MGTDMIISAPERLRLWTEDAMRFDKSALGILLLIVFFLFPPALSAADTEKPKKAAFVDLDGDGFNDNLADNNSDGIPDRYERGKSDLMLPKVGSVLGDVFNSEISMVGMEDLRSNEERFSLRKFRTQSLSQRCHGFGAEQDFGPGNGIGCGSLGGHGGCSGGACAP